MGKPAEFFVGVIDFFAVLLPGGILAAILQPLLAGPLVGTLIAEPADEAGRWGVFLAVAYFLGHLIFLLGSMLDPLYDTLRKRFPEPRNEAAHQAATAIRNQMLSPAQQQAINSFQWCRSVLISACAAAAEDVHRLEADSKFFRSLVVVLALAALVFAVRQQALAALVAAALIVPCLARYFERRRKSTTQAYWHVVSLYALGKLRSGD